VKSYQTKERFTDVMSSFITTAKSDLDQLEANVKLAEDKYSQAVTYFGEDSKTMAPDEFFGMFTRFFESLKDAHKQNELREQNIEKEIRREEAKNKRQAEMEAKKKGVNVPGNDSVVDELFGVLKGGNYFKSQRQQRASAVVPNPNPQPVVPPQGRTSPLKPTSSKNLSQSTKTDSSKTDSPSKTPKKP